MRGYVSPNKGHWHEAEKHVDKKISDKRVPSGHVYMKPHASLVEAQLGDSRTYHHIYTPDG